MLTSQLIKSEMTYIDVPEAERWRISTVMELMDVRDEKMELEGFSTSEVEEMLNFISTA